MTTAARRAGNSKFVTCTDANWPANLSAAATNSRRDAAARRVGNGKFVKINSQVTREVAAWRQKYSG